MDITLLRKQAEARYAQEGMPSIQDESWRFTDVSQLNPALFTASWKPSALAVTPLSACYIVVENGRLSLEKSNLDSLPKGVHVRPIMDCTDERLGSLADQGSGFVQLNTATFEQGVQLEVEAGVSLEAPIHLIHLSDNEQGAFQMRHLFALGEQAKVTIIEEYVGAAKIEYFMNVVSEVFVADGAHIDHYKLQRESESAYHFHTIEAQCGCEALFSNHAITIGGRLGRNDIRTRILGEQSEAICNGLYLLKEQQLFDTHLFMDHAVAKCNSHELYKGILADKAKSVFCGRILVQQDAQETDAIQSNANLLLSRGAKVHTMPQLEIYADDVKCTHGATIGELDEQALFYLQTRGVDPEGAHAMLTTAFANEVFDEVACETFKAYAEEMVKIWLSGVHA